MTGISSGEVVVDFVALDALDELNPASLEP